MPDAIDNLKFPNNDKLQVPASELNQMQIKFIKGEIWPEKPFDIMRLSDASPRRLLFGALVFIIALIKGRS